MNIKFGVCQWSLPGNGLYAVKMVAELGLQGLQLGLGSYRSGFYMSQKRVQDAFMEDAAKYGVEFPSLCMVSLEEHSFLGDENAEEYKIAYDTLKKGVEAARAMNIGTVMVPTFFKNDILTENDMAKAAKALKYTCELAGEYGIRVAHESTLDAERQLRLLQMVGLPNLSVFFDSQNYRYFKNLNTQELLRGIYLCICDQIHVKDGDNKKGLEGQVLLGQGDSGFFETMDILKKKDYSGWLLLENYYWKMPLREKNEDEYGILLEDLKVLKNAVL